MNGGDLIGNDYVVRNMWQMKALYFACPIPQTPSAESLLSSVAMRICAGQFQELRVVKTLHSTGC